MNEPRVRWCSSIFLYPKHVIVVVTAEIRYYLLLIKVSNAFVLVRVLIVRVLESIIGVHPERAVLSYQYLVVSAFCLL